MMRDEALSVLKKYNKSDSLLKHALAVEAVMRHFAAKAGEDVEYWGAVGLLHDIDYEMYPDEHCKKAPEMLRAAGYDEAFIHSVISHGHGICVDAKPEKHMEKVLFAADELIGLIGAAALMRPSRSVMDMEAKSVKKKFKDKSFAASVNREVILKGCEDLEIELDSLIEECILGMRAVASDIGL
ncbi:MAG TPA: HDIG domain-containing protein [Bacillota bacterium]|nr:HDIG domain-containing protein [Bacillota bacterium]HOG53474.1 HDIG domain-containing protein [Bacillota bacterium]